MDVLAKESKAEAAAAEAAVLESAAAGLDTSDENLFLPQQMENFHERTAEYVKKHQVEVETVIPKDVTMENSKTLHQAKRSDMTPKTHHFYKAQSPKQFN